MSKVIGFLNEMELVYVYKKTTAGGIIIYQTADKTYANSYFYKCN